MKEPSQTPRDDDAAYGRDQRIRALIQQAQSEIWHLTRLSVAFDMALSDARLPTMIASASMIDVVSRSLGNTARALGDVVDRRRLGEVAEANEKPGQ